MDRRCAGSSSRRGTGNGPPVNHAMRTTSTDKAGASARDGLRRLFTSRKAIDLALVIVVAAVLFSSFDVRELLREALGWIEQLGAWGQTGAQANREAMI